MPIKTIKVNKAGLEFQITSMPVTEQTRYMLQIQKVLGGSAIGIASGVGGSDKEQLEAFSRVIDKISSHLDVESFMGIQSGLLTTGYVFGAGKRIDSLDDFGSYETTNDVDGLTLMHQVFFEVLKLNFQGPLKRLGKSLGSLIDPPDQAKSLKSN